MKTGSQLQELAANIKRASKENISKKGKTTTKLAVTPKIQTKLKKEFLP